MSTLVKPMEPEQSLNGETAPAPSDSQPGQLALPSKMLMTPKHSKPSFDTSAWDIPESILSSQPKSEPSSTR